jgi:hypothetical protein
MNYKKKVNTIRNAQFDTSTTINDIIAMIGEPNQPTPNYVCDHDHTVTEKHYFWRNTDGTESIMVVTNNKNQILQIGITTKSGYTEKNILSNRKEPYRE